MNIAIIDDLKTDSDRLVGLINTYMEQHRLQCRTMDLFSSGESFLDTFTSGKYHLIFLDIYMDGITGMETAKRIRQTDHDCRIIFITTSPEFAVESYNVNASFYLLSRSGRTVFFPPSTGADFRRQNSPDPWRLQLPAEGHSFWSMRSPTPNMQGGRSLCILKMGRNWQSP